MVNQPFVDRHFDGASPLGGRIRRITPGDQGSEVGEWIEIVGVVPDLEFSPGDASRAAGFYLALGATNRFWIAARTDLDLAAFDDAIRRAVAAVDPEVRVESVLPLDQAGWEARALLRALARL